MKQSFKYIWTILLAIGLSPLLQAQEYTTEAFNRQAGYWTLGINGGLAYQQSDVCSVLDGYGFGLTLAKNVYYRPGDLFSFDLRGRALFSQTYGFDDTPSYGIKSNEALNGTINENLDYQNLGFVYQNHRTDMFELGLEGVLNFNRLRERTNIILSLYGGIGLDLYQVNIDQLDAQGGLYDYKQFGNDVKRSDIRSILDKDYETIADGFDTEEIKVGFMPALGIELGYQLSPRFSVGIGHKVTFSQTDLLDGQRWRNDNSSSTDNDIHHYTNLHLRWIIDPGKRQKLSPPIIDVTQPYGNPYTTNEASTEIRANIKHVKSSMDVDYFVNGQQANFNYNDGRFASRARLRPGRNEVLIKAHNSVGSDEARIIINYNQDVIVPPPAMNRPEVDFIRPASEGTTVQERNYNISAYVYNVYNKSDIELSVNGNKKSKSSFSFDEDTQILRAKIRLRDGENYIRVAGKNKAGRDQENTSIIYGQTTSVENPPTVNITQPNRNPYTTENSNATIRATINNVSNQRNIQFYLNGRTTNNFNFSGNKLTANIQLKRGNNDIKIKVRNSDGQDSDQTRIIYDKEVIITPTVKKPVVTITSASMPTQNPLNPGVCKSTIIAKILNITSKNNIQFSVNGRNNNNFSFNTATKEFKSLINLEPGNNNVRIKASNSAGSDQDNATVTCESSKRPPTISITLPTKTTSSTTKATQAFKAVTKHVNSKNNIEFRFNGTKTTSFNFNPSTGLITKTLTLKEGNNTVEVKVSNNDGTDRATAKIKYTKATTLPKNPPVVSISKPRNNSTVSKASTILNAKVLNVGNKSQIKVTLNNKNITNFSYNIRTKAISTTLNLKEGKNTIVVKGTNSDGSDQASAVVNYKIERNPPQVSITSPRNNTTVSKNFETVKASIKNVSSKSGINFKINGKSTSAFTLVGTSLSAMVNLKEGKNIILIKATNNDGEAEDQVVINYKKAAAKPVVKFTSPSKPGVSSTKSSYTIKASTQNVAKKSELSIKLNNRAVKNFTFENNVITMKVNLARGNNNISIKATNAGGTATAQTSIIYTAPTIAKAPIVKILSTSQPTINPLNPNAAKSTVIASVLNVASKNEIKVTVNGQSFTGFIYTPSTKQVVASVNLQKGTNTIVISATNAGGTDKKTTTVEF